MAQKNTTQSSDTSKKQPKRNPSHVGAAVLGGLAAAAAIGGYFLYNNVDAKKKVKNIRGWMIKAKGEVLEKIEKIKDVNEDAYHKVVDAVMSRYTKLSNIDTAEIAKLTKELKTHWKSIQKDVKQSGQKISSTVKKVAHEGKKKTAK